MTQKQFNATLDTYRKRGTMIGVIPDRPRYDQLFRWKKKTQVPCIGVNYKGSYFVIFLDRLAFMGVMLNKGEEG